MIERVPRRPRLQPRKIPRQSRSTATVDAMVEAAARILRAEGYERATVNRVAQVAGVSVGSLYQYFPTKEALVGAVAARLSQRMMDCFTGELGQLADLPLAEVVSRVIAGTFRAFRLDPILRRVLREQVPEVTIVFQTPDFDAALRRAIVQHLETRRAQLRPADLELAARLVMIAVEAIAEACGSDAADDASPIVTETVDLVTRYLLRAP
jgi:AcrR family transcriptional regulator